MATWALISRLTNNTDLTVNATDEISFNGNAYGDNITVNQYQNSTHIVTASAAAERCTGGPHPHNTKYLTSGTVSIDGAGSTALPVATGSCPLRFEFTDASAISTQGATFYAYDGTTDATAWAGVDVKAAEGGNHASWTTPQGSGSAMSLADQSSSTSHLFYIAISVSPTSTGLKTGKVKIALTYF